MTETESMRDHWWWRPGWQTGRSFYTWHVTFSDQPAVERLVQSYEPVLAKLAVLDPVPLQWLHLTMQGVGFTDEVTESDVSRIIDAARQRCAKLEPFVVTIGPAQVDPETIQMAVRPTERLAELRNAIRTAIGTVWGPEKVPEPADGYRPHVSLGYSNSAGPATSVTQTLAEHGGHSAQVEVRTVSLIDLNRDKKAYEWADVATIPLGGANG